MEIHPNECPRPNAETIRFKVIQTSQRHSALTSSLPTKAVSQFVKPVTPTFLKPMKTPFLKVSPVLILPAALLLIQCAPTDGIAPKSVVAFPTSTSHWMQISSGLSLFDPSGIPGSETWSAPAENEDQPIPAEDWVDTNASAPDVVVLPPLIVTDTLQSAFLAGMEYWPNDVVDVERKKAWISTKQPDIPRYHPMDDAGYRNIPISYP